MNEPLPTEALALELQRSLDYFERQMGQAPPAVFYLGGAGVREDKIAPAMRESMIMPPAFFPVTDFCKPLRSSDEGILQLCLGAIGAVYRAPEAQ